MTMTCPMTRTEKIERLRVLEASKIIREECPEPDEHGGTAYWPFKVLIPSKLPPEFQEEYKRLGELRW